MEAIKSWQLLPTIPPSSQPIKKTWKKSVISTVFYPNIICWFCFLSSFLYQSTLMLNPRCWRHIVYMWALLQQRHLFSCFFKTSRKKKIVRVDGGFFLKAYFSRENFLCQWNTRQKDWSTSSWDGASSYTVSTWRCERKRVGGRDQSLGYSLWKRCSLDLRWQCAPCKHTQVVFKCPICCEQLGGVQRKDTLWIRRKSKTKYSCYDAVEQFLWQ